MAAMAGSRTSSTSPLCALASPRTIHIRFGAIAQLAQKERSFTSLRAIRLKKKKGKGKKMVVVSRGQDCVVIIIQCLGKEGASNSPLN